MPPTWKQTQGADYSGVTEIATIGYAQVNALAANPTGSIQLVGVIPANAIVVGMYSKITEAFASATRNINGGVTFGLDNSVPPILPISNGYISAAETLVLNSERSYYLTEGYLEFKQVAQDIFVGFNWIAADVNPQNYTAGEIKFYLEYKTFPTLN